MKYIIVILFFISLYNVQAQSNSLEELTRRGNVALTKMMFENGISFMQSGNYRKAVTCFSNVLRVFPSADVYYNRGICKVHLGDLQSGVSDFSAAIKLRPGYGDAYMNRGVTRIALGNSSGGCADLQRASSLGVYCEDLIRKFCR